MIQQLSTASSEGGCTSSDIYKCPCLPFFLRKPSFQYKFNLAFSFKVMGYCTHNYVSYVLPYGVSIIVSEFNITKIIHCQLEQMSFKQRKND